MHSPSWHDRICAGLSHSRLAVTREVCHIIDWTHSQIKLRGMEARLADSTALSMSGNISRQIEMQWGLMEVYVASPGSPIETRGL